MEIQNLQAARERIELLELVLRNLGNNADDLLYSINQKGQAQDFRLSGVKAALMSAAMVLKDPNMR